MDYGVAEASARGALEASDPGTSVERAQVFATLAVAAAVDRVAEMLAKMLDDGLPVNQKDYRI